MTGGRTRRLGVAMPVLALTQVVLLVAGVVSTFSVGRDDHGCSGPNRPRAILECLNDSTAFIRTASSTGTGLIVHDGYVVTNAHVVDPFAAATVVLGDERHEDVPLVGVDHFADIAVLGPIDTDADPIRLAEEDVEQGDTVFLVGFPGEAESEPEPAISQGILSRVREPQEFDLTYLQTDASIGGGQSGGALVDAEGGVLGVSGLSFAENFALALDFGDVARIVNSIVDGEGDDVRTWPSDGEKSHDVRIQDIIDPQVVAVPVSEDERVVTFDIADVPRPYLAATDVFAGPVGVSQNYLDDASTVAEFYGVTEEEVRQSYGNSPGIVEQTGETTFDVHIRAGSLVFVEVLALDFVSDGVVTASEPVATVDLGGDRETLEPDEVMSGTLGSLESTDLFDVELEEGMTVEVYVGSPVGDMAFAIKAPDQTWVDAEYADDSDGGLYGFDARITYEVTKSGRHRIEVFAFDPISVGYVIEVRTR